MEALDYIPKDYNRILVVGSLADFFNTQFTPAVNCILHPRRLSGDFNALAQAIARDAWKMDSRESYDFTLPHFEAATKKLRRANDGAGAAAKIVLADMKTMMKRHHRKDISLRFIKEKAYAAASTDVKNFHADNVDYPLGRILCAYNDPVTEFIRNEDAVKLERGEYSAREGAPVYGFASGDLWRQTGRQSQYDPESYKGLEPFIHRAPRWRAGNAPRLLLVAG